MNSILYINNKKNNYHQYSKYTVEYYPIIETQKFKFFTLSKRENEYKYVLFI